MASSSRTDGAPRRLASILHMRDIGRGPKRHAEYYFADGAVVIQVEDTMYRLHEFVLGQSVIWNAQFTASAGKTNSGSKGMIKLEPLVTKTEFDCFLKYLYAFQYQPREYTLQDLKIILRLANMWRFTVIQRSVLDLLYSLDLGGTDCLKIGRRYKTDAFLLNGYIALCCRPAPMDDRVFQLIAPYFGNQKFFDLLRARELVRNRLQSIPSRRSHGPSQWPCLDTTRHPCHTSTGFQNALARALALEPSEEDKTLDDVIIENVKQDRSVLCPHCAPLTRERFHEFIEMEKIKAMVFQIMIESGHNYGAR